MGSSAQWQRVSAWWWQAAGAGCRAQGAGSRDTLAALLGGARTHARACTREGASARALARGLRPQAGHVAELLRTQAQACRSVDLSAPPKVRLRRSPPSKNHAPPRLESGIYKPGSEPRWRYCRAVASVAAAVTVCTRLTALAHRDSPWTSRGGGRQPAVRSSRFLGRCYFTKKIRTHWHVTTMGPFPRPSPLVSPPPTLPPFDYRVSERINQTRNNPRVLTHEPWYEIFNLKYGITR
jgi:hypothetical protein